MLRITRVDGNGRAVTLRLEGKLLAPWVGEVRSAWAPSAGEAGPLRLDLAAVTYVDGAGTELLRDLLGRGATLAACSGYVAQLLHVEKP